MRIVFYDCECVHSPEEEGYSWGRPWGLGLAVCATMEKEDGARQWLAEDAPALVAYLTSADAVVGFNGLKFDLPLINGEAERQSSGGYDYIEPLEPLAGILADGLDVALVDMLLDVQKVVGRFTSGTNLKALSVHTLGKKPGMTGDIAPIAWADHRILEVIQYCADDVAWSRELFNHGLKHGWLRRPAGKREQRKGQNRPPIKFDITWTVRSAAGKILQPFRTGIRSGRHPP